MKTSNPLNRLIGMVLSLLMVMSMVAVPVVSAESVEITSSVSGTTIPTSGTITFTFAEAISEASLAAGFVFSEENKVTSAWNTRVCNYDLNNDGTVLTVTFAEGDLAPGTKYQFKFVAESLLKADGTSTALDSDVTYTYTTEENGYFINDNFSRYPLNTWLGNSSSSANYTTVLPWHYMAGNGGRGSADITSGTNGKTVLQLKSNKNNDGNNFMTVGYRANYLPATETTATACYNVTEIDFEISGGVDASYLLGGIFVIRRHETLNKFFLYYGTGKVDSALAGREHIAPLCEVAAPAVGTMSAHSMKYVISTDMSDGISRTLREFSLDGTKLTQVIDTINTETGAITYKDFPVEGIGLSIRSDVYPEYYYQNSATDYRVFSIGRDSALAFDTAEGTVGSSGTLRQEEALLKVYSFKHYLCDSFKVLEGRSAMDTEVGSFTKSIDIVNFTDKEITPVVVMAIYDSNGLVGINGVDSVSCPVNSIITVPRTVTDEALKTNNSGYTYKVIVLDSWNSLKPKCESIDGAVIQD